MIANTAHSSAKQRLLSPSPERVTQEGSAVFNLRLRHAETALRDDRLDEARDLVTEPSVREHRDGQALITRLIDAYLERARQHLAANRLEEARRACRHAEELGGQQVAIAEVAVAIAEQTRDQLRRDQQNKHLVAEARDELKRGDCETSERILQRAAAPDSTIGILSEDVAIRRERVEAALQRAQKLSTASRMKDRVAAVLALQELSPDHTALPDLIDQLTGPAVTEIADAIGQARLDRASTTLDAVRPLITLDSELGELDQFLKLSHRVAQQLETFRYSEALVELRRLNSRLDNASWLRDLIIKVEDAASLMTELRSTPLSLLSGMQSPNVSDSLRDFATISAAPLTAPAEAGRYILRIDGVGTVLLLSAPRIAIGPVTREKQVDLPLRGYTASSHTTIERTDGDYRDQSGRPLGSDQKLDFGPRCQVRFRIPNSLTRTAVIDLTGTVLQRPDIRSVILFDETLIVGPARTSHIVTRALEKPLVVFRRGGDFFVRSGIPDRANRQAPGDSPRLDLSQPVEIDGMRVTLSPAF